MFEFPFAFLSLTFIFVGFVHGVPFVNQPSLSSLSPATIDGPSDRSVSDCKNLDWDLSQDCWAKLGVSEHITTWWESNESDCVEHGATFASCYQQMAGWEENQCDTTGTSQCGSPSNFTGYTPHQAYVLYSIFAVWQWYQSIFDAIENADVSSTGPVGKIVTTINPEKPSTQPLGDFLQALSAMTPLIKAPAFIGRLASVFETSLRQSPGVFKELYPSGTLDSEFTQLNDISDGLSKVKTTYQSNISVALQLVQQSHATFSSFVANGSFIAPRTSLEAQTESLIGALQTFVVASSLTASNIIITLARETDPHALATNGSLTTPGLVECASYDQYGMCSTWWYDPSTNAAFGLASLGDPSKNYYDLMQTIFSNNWTTPADLFLGAKACADYVAVFGGNSTPTLDLNNLQPLCLSNTQICVYDQACDVDDPTCEFTGEYGLKLCGPQNGYLQDGCGGSDDIPTVKVPASYLGPMDLSENDDLIICH
ncbi:hypothetical protein MMC06_006224 [Schaereria dolodes]|nr:hypothetical protein [Schaereria dolodes]